MHHATLLLVLLFPLTALAGDDLPACEQSDGHPNLLANDYLKRVFRDHEEWWSEAQREWSLGPWFRDPDLAKDPRRVNLCKRVLNNIQFPHLVLAAADLSYVIFADVRLQAADLSFASLALTSFMNTTLEDAVLVSADLRRADLSGVKASGADFREANLAGARFLETDLTNASFWGANLSGAYFDPAPGKLPNVDHIAQANGLSALRYEQPRALVNLRRLFQEAGYREQERSITFALRHAETAKQLSAEATFFENIEGSFNYWLFEYTTKWGMEPGRAIVILILLIPVFAFPYAIVLWRPSKDGIWRFWSEDRARDDLGGGKPELVRARGIAVLGYGLYFSLLTAFHLGWRELNVGNWISRMQPREYTLRASGWVRTVAGVQSLISVYLLAIWALTYFGRPFE